MDSTSAGIPQLWSSSLQETHTHMQRGGSNGVDQSTLVADGLHIPMDEAATMPISPPGPWKRESVQMKALLKTRPFQYTAATVFVFLFSFLLLVAIQPPFTYKNETDNDKDKHGARKFSPVKASFYALGATGVGFLIALCLYIVSYKNDKKLHMAASK